MSFDRMQGELGLPVGVSVKGFDLAASTATIRVTKPGAAGFLSLVVTWQATIDAVTETVSHILGAGDLDRPGRYWLVGIVTKNDGSKVRETEPIELLVGPVQAAA